MYYWLNVDIPTSDAKLHLNSCRYAQEISATDLKGIGQMKRDGGWMPVESRSQAESFLRDVNASVVLTECPCMRARGHAH